MRKLLNSAIVAATAAVVFSAGPAMADPAAAPDCPLTAEDLTAVTPFAWEFRARAEDSPYPFDPSIRRTVCEFATSTYRDEYGNPLFFRAEVANGEHGARYRQHYDNRCAPLGGTERPS
ncbi:MAG: hypothetical protein ACREMG_15005, partial [Gemmatimonadales bacterium]